MSLPHSHISQSILLGVHWIGVFAGCQESEHGVYHGIWTKEVKYGGTILFLVTLFDDLSVAIATQSILSAIGIPKNLCYHGQ